MEASCSPSPLVELEIAFARSRRAAFARRTRTARRAHLSRRASRTLAGLLIVLVALLAGTAPVATAPLTTAPPRQSRPATPRCPAAGDFLPAFRAASHATTLPLPLLVAVAWEESRLNENALSPAGARGLLQLMPDTARLMDLRDASPRANILAGARYLRRMLDRFGGHLDLALAAYNAGPAAVDEADGAPTIATLRYALNIEARAASLATCG